jgi:DNA repair ATPase RecN
MNENIALAVIGAAITGGFGLIFWFVQRYFSSQEKILCRQQKLAEQLLTSLHEIKVLTAHLKEKTDRIDSTVGNYTKDLGKIEGRLDEHINMIANYIQTIGHISRQMDAVFKYIDADRRPTDIKRG